MKLVTKMRSNYLLLILVFSIISCSGEVIQRSHRGENAKNNYQKFYTSVKKKVALLTFFNEAPYGGEDLAITATEEIRKELSGTGEFIIDPMAMKIFGSSKEIYAGGGVKLVQLSRKAKVSGINFVIIGRIIDARIRQKTDEIGVVRETKSYTESKVEIRIFDVNSNKELFSETIPGYADDSSYRFFATQSEEKLQYRQELLRYGVKIAIRRSIPKILDVAAKLDWIGRVAKIVGNKIYLNAGRTSGLNIGDILKVITEGTEIFDPETGALIGVSKGEIKGTIEVIDYVGPDVSVAVLHSGGSVVEGDFIQLY